MPRTTYTANPDQFATGGIASNVSPDDTEPVRPAARVGTLAIIAKGDNRRGSLIRMDLGDIEGTDIPAGSIITDAYLRFLPNLTRTSVDATDIAIALSVKDGIWDLLAGTTDEFGQFMNTSALDITINGVTGTWDSAKTPDQGVPLRADNTQTVTAMINKLGQALRINTAITTLDTIDVEIQRIDTDGGDVWIEVYEWTASADEIGGASPTILATSDLEAFNGISTSTGGKHTFSFSGGDRISWGANARRAFVLATDLPIVVGNIPSLIIRFDQGASVSDGGIMIAGLATGWSPKNYPGHGLLPKLFETDDSTIDTAPFLGADGIHVVDFPDTWVEEVFIEVRPPNLHHTIQRWIQDPGYVEGDPLSLIFQPTNDTTFGLPAPLWDDTELVIDHRPRDLHVG